MIPFVEIVVLAFAAYRAARIFTSDTITLRLRVWLYRWAWIDPGTEGYPEEPAEWPVDEDGTWEPVPRGPLRIYINELFTCPHCLGVWAAGVLYVLWRWGGEVVNGLVVVLAIAGVASLVAQLVAKASE